MNWVRSIISAIAIGASLATAGSNFGGQLYAWKSPSTNGLKDLAPFLRPFLEESSFPSLAAAVVHKDKIIAAGATGTRKAGEDAPVTLGDKYHIGSCTKSITALLAMQLEREGVIALDAKPVQVFPDWDFAEGSDAITLRMLLQNRSGIGNDPGKLLWARAVFTLRGPNQRQRETFLSNIVEKDLEAAPGAKFIYSNLGFALAGAMLETRAKKPWEDLVREKIFQPLKLSSAGFGAPAEPGKLDQPYGHQMRDGEAVPVPPSDNPVAIAPAGAAHMSILDLARYAAFHMQAARGEIPELKQYIAALYTPPEGSEYAAGWLVLERDWAGGKALTHAGSNTMFHALIWIAPEKEYAFVVATNLGDRENVTAEKVDRVIGQLIKAHIQ